MHPTAQDLAWLRLSFVKNIKTQDVLRVAMDLGSPEAIFDASYGTLVKMLGEETARAIRLSQEDERVENTVDWLNKTPEASLIGLSDADYPSLMISAGMAPLVLFARGNRNLLNPNYFMHHVTIMGSGSPDQEGEYNAREFGMTFGRKKFPFSVGLYPGVEEVFLRSAVMECHAPAIVWGSTGPDRIWPREEADLLRAVLDEKGLLLTPFPPGAGVCDASKEYQAICRLAAASGLFVIRASRQSKCLEMARLAADWGRDLFAIPGSIHDPQSKGCHRLIKQGAHLVESIEDVKDGIFERL